MTGRRTGYVVALVVAAVVLVGSVAAAAAWGANQTSWSSGRSVGGSGDSRGGGWTMMGGGMGWDWDDDGSSTLTLDQARDDAQTWVDDHASGATLDEGVAAMHGYRFTATSDGTLVAVVVVRQDGTVIGHLVSTSSPSPTS